MAGESIREEDDHQRKSLEMGKVDRGLGREGEMEVKESV